MNLDVKIVKVRSWDVRFPTSKNAHGSDAVHGLVDYSCVYVQIFTDAPDDSLIGCGLTFTIGRGNEVVKKCVDSLKSRIMGVNLSEIVREFGQFAHSLANDNQMRWLGPDGGVLSLACCAILNAIWDLWAKIEQKPIWRLLCDMNSKDLINCGIWKHLADELSPQEALDMLTSVESADDIKRRIDHVTNHGVAAYTTACGWLGYTDDYMKDKIQNFMSEGWTAFKIKVGVNLQDDIRRCKMVRELIGSGGKLMVDCNQKWEVDEAVKWVRELSPSDIYWIEEPTHPDDIIGHQKIKSEVNKLGVRVATGEVCKNRVLFKQMCSQGALDICQIDCARVLSINELIPILLLCRKYNITVCPHGGGVGLCEMIQHLAAFNYVRIAPLDPNSDSPPLVEHADHLSHHFEHPLNCFGGVYNVPESKTAGYTTTLKTESLAKYAVSMSE